MSKVMASNVVSQSLFSAGSRTDNGPKPYAWRAYRCPDRSHIVRDAEVRRELDAWFSRLPPKAAAQIAQRFQSDDDTEHLGAFLELYVHEVGLGMGAEVDIDIGNDEADDRRPDFLVRWGDLEVYVDATAVEGDDVHTKHHKLNLDKVHDAINEVIAPRFFVNVSVLRSTPSTPPLRRLTGSVQRWLDGLDSDVVRADAHRDPDYPHTTVVELGGWVIQLRAFAVDDDGHDFPHHRVIGTRFDGVGSIDDLAPLRRKFKKKAAPGAASGSGSASATEHGCAWPRLSGVITRKSSLSSGSSGSHMALETSPAWMSTIGVPDPPSSQYSAAPITSIERPSPSGMPGSTA